MSKLARAALVHATTQILWIASYSRPGRVVEV